MKRILTVIGARPQFIKAAAVSRVIRSTQLLHEILIHTGQHYDENMSDIFFQQLGIPAPKINLDIGSSSHGKQTGAMLDRIEQIIQHEHPDGLLVYGDTNSTLAGALAAAKLHIPVMHVEAGLRSFNKKMPEEINRILTDHCSTLLFAPTETAVKNLLNEGIPASNIHQVGDVMYDAALHFGKISDQQSSLVSTLGLTSKQYVLSTIHRAENTDDPTRLSAILDGLARVARHVRVVLPLHPRTKKMLEQHPQHQQSLAALTILPPVGYLDMIQLEKHAALVATDSGGVQKEAYFCQVPCVTLRDESEWVELVEAGWNTLVPPTSADAIANTILARLNTKGKPCSPYGDGQSALKIVQIMAEFFAQTARA